MKDETSLSIFIGKLIVCKAPLDTFENSRNVSELNIKNPQNPGKKGRGPTPFPNAEPCNNGSLLQLKEKAVTR